jgi:beta-glucanase (GH16 family)
MNTIGLFGQTYGVFEARIKVPTEPGLWPAFWMQGSNYARVGLPAAGEIDVMEINNQAPSNVLTAFTHAPHHAYRTHYELSRPLSSGYHVYGVEWTPHGITFMADGNSYAYMPAYTGWPFDHSFNIILDLAVGGRWPGSPGSATHFPAHMYVDWVRVYRHR